MRKHKETGSWKYHVCHWECQCHDLKRRRQKDQSLERLSCSPSVVDFVTRGAQRDRKHFRPHSHPLQTRNKSTPLVFWLWERHTAWIINKGQTITISCLSESCHLSVAGIKNSVELVSQESNTHYSHKDNITLSLRILSRSSNLLSSVLQNYFITFPTSDDRISSHLYK